MTAVRSRVTSAPDTVLDAIDVLTVTREQWGSETGLHGRRDRCFQEDVMRTQTGQAPHVLAALNNLALGLLGRQGITHVAEAQRASASHLDRFLQPLMRLRRAPAADELTWQPPYPVSICHLTLFPQRSTLYKDTTIYK
jgi:hypothetical protein